VIWKDGELQSERPSDRTSRQDGALRSQMARPRESPGPGQNDCPVPCPTLQSMHSTMAANRARIRLEHTWLSSASDGVGGAFCARCQNSAFTRVAVPSVIIPVRNNNRHCRPITIISLTQRNRTSRFSLRAVQAAPLLFVSSKDFLELRCLKQPKHLDDERLVGATAGSAGRPGGGKAWRSVGL
jgi:hypothetical protein